MLEITSPGPLPETMPVEKLGSGRSEIRNRVLAPIFKDLKLIEAWGTGIQKMRQEIAGYPELDLVLQEAGHSFQVQIRKKPAEEKSDSNPLPIKIRQASDMYRTSPGQAPDKLKLLDFCRDERSVREMMTFLALKHRETFSTNHLCPLLKEGLIAMTIPDKPKSPKQKYKTTALGWDRLDKG